MKPEHFFKDIKQLSKQERIEAIDEKIEQLEDFQKVLLKVYENEKPLRISTTKAIHRNIAFLEDLKERKKKEIIILF